MTLVLSLVCCLGGAVPMAPAERAALAARESHELAATPIGHGRFDLPWWLVVAVIAPVVIVVGGIAVAVMLW